MFREVAGFVGLFSVAASVFGCSERSCAEQRTCEVNSSDDSVVGTSVPPLASAGQSGTSPGREASTPSASPISTTDAGGISVDIEGVPIDLIVISCDNAFDCDDGIDCTVDRCVAGECQSAADSSLCLDALDGVCHVETGCQYATCTAETCVAGECQTARCDGDTCVRESLCDEGQGCCAGECAPIGCEDGIDCTEDICGETGCEHIPRDAECPSGQCQSASCDAALGCVAVPVEGSCDDGIFCNGQDTCIDGDCGGHSGSPCSGESQCDEVMRTCLGCASDAECPETQYGPWGQCAYPSECAMDGERARTATSFQCVGGECVKSEALSVDYCFRFTDELPCGEPVFGAYSACDFGGSDCAEMGIRQRTRTSLACLGGSCETSASIETDSCSRSTDGAACGNTLFCDGVDVCSNGSCLVAGSSPCTSIETCDEAADACLGPYDPRTGPFNMLVYSATTGFRHTAAIAAGTDLLEEIADEHDIAVTFTEDSSLFSDEGLADFEVIFFLNTSGDILAEAQENAFEAWMTNNGGFVGTHSATDTEEDWVFYTTMIGQYYDGHLGSGTLGSIGFTDEALDHPAISGLPNPWAREEEWFFFNSHGTWSLRAGFQILGRVTAGEIVSQPIIWLRENDTYRLFYSGLGHSAAHYEDASTKTHLTGAILWAARREHLL